MLRTLQVPRFFCTKIKAASDTINLQTKTKGNKVDFTQLNNKTKVPQEPVLSQFPEDTKEVKIDDKTIRLLERLSLVDLDSREALETLKSSIQFADKITQIDTTNVKPLYTVLEWQQLLLRNDQVTEGNCRQKVLLNAKVTDEDYFVAPPGNIPLEQGENSFTNEDEK